MSDKFLNNRLITTRRFKPQQEKNAKTDSDIKNQLPKHVAEEDELADLQRAENDAVHKEALAAEWKELRVHHHELLSKLDDAIEQLDQQQRYVEAVRAELQEHKATLKQLNMVSNFVPDNSEVRQAKRKVQNAHLELVKYERRQTPADESKHILLSLTFGQLTRLGLGISWPLIATLIFSAALIVAAVALSFGL